MNEIARCPYQNPIDVEDWRHELKYHSEHGWHWYTCQCGYSTPKMGSKECAVGALKALSRPAAPDDGKQAGDDSIQKRTLLVRETAKAARARGHHETAACFEYAATILEAIMTATDKELAEILSGGISAHRAKAPDDGKGQPVGESAIQTINLVALRALIDFSHRKISMEHAAAVISNESVRLLKAAAPQGWQQGAARELYDALHKLKCISMRPDDISGARMYDEAVATLIKYQRHQEGNK